jgi:hypothetical protein
LPSQIQLEVLAKPENVRGSPPPIVGRFPVQGPRLVDKRSVRNIVLAPISDPQQRLRSANDLAQLRRTESKVNEARRMLLSVLNALTEGFATRDLKVAATLLTTQAGQKN